MVWVREELDSAGVVLISMLLPCSEVLEPRVSLAFALTIPVAPFIEGNRELISSKFRDALHV